MAGYCASVRQYSHKPQASKNTAKESHLPSQPSNNTTPILVTSRKQTTTAHVRFKGCCCLHIFNELQAVGLLLALDGTNMCTDPFTSGKKYCRLMLSSSVMKVYSLFQQRLPVHSNQSTHPGYYAAYALWAMKYGLLNMGKYLSCRSSRASI